MNGIYLYFVNNHRSRWLLLNLNKCNVICHEEIHSDHSCMACGIIMLKKTGIGIVLKQLDNMPRKNFISVALDIQIPFSNDKISVKAMCNASPDQDTTTPPKQSCLSQHHVNFSYGILEPWHHLDEW